THGAAVCAVCLGLHPDPANCNARAFWNGGETRSHRMDRKLYNSRGDNLCLDFQLPRGCQGRAGPKHIHECSGCGANNHGASRCPRRQT
ncbi:hypothetical protein GGX14DRAFT_382713, partial [Mycena pura]